MVTADREHPAGYMSLGVPATPRLRRGLASATLCSSSFWPSGALQAHAALSPAPGSWHQILDETNRSNRKRKTGATKTTTRCCLWQNGCRWFGVCAKPALQVLPPHTPVSPPGSSLGWNLRRSEGGTGLLRGVVRTSPYHSGHCYVEVVLRCVPGIFFLFSIT